MLINGGAALDFDVETWGLGPGRSTAYGSVCGSSTIVLWRSWGVSGGERDKVACFGEVGDRLVDKFLVGVDSGVLLGLSWRTVGVTTCWLLGAP